jgi:hypothetical protein
VGVGGERHGSRARYGDNRRARNHRPG